MTTPFRPLLRTAVISLAVAATLAGCNRDKEAAGPAAPAAGAATGAVITPADAAAPMAYESKTPFAEVNLTLPVVIKSQPDLHARLYAAAVRDLRQFSEGAQADRTEAGGDAGQPPYDKSIEITPGAETGKLFSLIRTDSEFTGGAHPNSSFASILWDKALKREIVAANLFKTGDLSALDAALCAAVNAEKRKRPAGPDHLPDLGGLEMPAGVGRALRAGDQHPAGQGRGSGVPDRPLSGRALLRRAVRGHRAPERVPLAAVARLSRRIRRRAEAGDLTPAISGSHRPARRTVPAGRP